MSEAAPSMLLTHLQELFESSFGPVDEKRMLHVHAPGRSEISGNHTDHEGGHIIAAALDVAVDGIARANGTNVVRVASEGYEPFEITLDSLEIAEEEKGTIKIACWDSPRPL